MIAYLSGPLFSIAEREFNKTFARCLQSRVPGLRIILPQVDAEPEPETDNFAAKVYQNCLHLLNKADLVIAILEGSDADSGTCVEMGYAVAKGIPIIGVRTDFRASQDRGVNRMVSQACTELVSTTTESIEYLADTVSAAIVQVTKNVSSEH